MPVPRSLPRGWIAEWRYNAGHLGVIWTPSAVSVTYPITRGRLPPPSLVQSHARPSAVPDFNGGCFCELECRCPRATDATQPLSYFDTPSTEATDSSSPLHAILHRYLIIQGADELPDQISLRFHAFVYGAVLRHSRYSTCWSPVVRALLSVQLIMSGLPSRYPPVPGSAPTHTHSGL